MLCKFCKREFDTGLTECPYCHCKVDIEATELTRAARDTFEGVTIEEDGSIKDGAPDYKEEAQEESTARQGRTAGPGFKVYNLSGFGGSLIWTILILICIAALIFFVLPTFLVVGAIVAVLIYLAQAFM